MSFSDFARFIHELNSGPITLLWNKVSIGIDAGSYQGFALGHEVSLQVAQDFFRSGFCNCQVFQVFNVAVCQT